MKRKILCEEDEGEFSYSVWWWMWWKGRELEVDWNLWFLWVFDVTFLIFIFKVGWILWWSYECEKKDKGEEDKRGMSFNEIDDEVGDECDLGEYKELKKDLIYYVKLFFKKNS